MSSESSCFVVSSRVSWPRLRESNRRRSCVGRQRRLNKSESSIIGGESGQRSAATAVRAVTPACQPRPLHLPPMTGSSRLWLARRNGVWSKRTGRHQTRGQRATSDILAGRRVWVCLSEERWEWACRGWGGGLHCLANFTLLECKETWVFGTILPWPDFSSFCSFITWHSQMKGGGDNNFEGDWTKQLSIKSRINTLGCTTLKQKYRHFK